MRLMRLALSGAIMAILAAPVMAKQWHNLNGSVTNGVVIEDGKGRDISGKFGSYISAGAGQYGLSASSVVGLTVPSGATIAEICVEGAAVRYRDDGVAPTATVGMPVAAGSCFPYSGPLSSVQFIAQSGSPTLDVSYYK